MLRSFTAVVFSIGVFASAASARAAELYQSGDLDVRWDTTLRYSGGIRLNRADDYLLASQNQNDGDRNFAPGVMSDRLDLLSIFDLAKDGFGFQVGVDAWYDTVYHARTAIDTKFPPAVRNLEGQYAELADTFFYGGFSLADTPVTFRAGRQTLLWGESLFFDDNSIAAAQAPVDYQKIITAPVPYSNDVYLPVDQLSVVVQPSSDISLSAYYQFLWRGSRLPAVGSYFSTTDVLGVGAERLFLGHGQFLVHDTNQKPNEGQFGVSLHVTENDLDLGFYLLRYDAKYPVLNIKPFAGTPTGPGYSGEFNSIYPSGIMLYGMSFSTYLDDIHIAGEFAARRDAPLSGYTPPTLYPDSNFSEYGEGNTLHGQFSAETMLPPTPGWDSAEASAEISTNYIVKVTENAAMLDFSEQRFSAAIRTHFEPHYFEVAPNIDLSVPLGLGYVMSGRYGSAYMESQGAGDFEGGFSIRYMSVWTASLTLTGFFGSPTRQPLTDRTFVAFSVERTF